MAHTHDVTLAATTATKRYTTWGRGEHRREWAVLQHLDRHAPGLAPRPLTAHLTASPPVITMSRLPGVPLAGRLGRNQVQGLVAALERLWKVPLDGVADLGPPVDVLEVARRLTTGARPGGGITAAAFDAAQAWWSGPDPALLTCAAAATVLGHRDPHLENYLWDGQRVRILDVEDAAPSDPTTGGSSPGAGCGPCSGCMLLPGGPSERRNPRGTADLQAQRLLSLLSC
jgi:hypothetical protein